MSEPAVFSPRAPVGGTMCAASPAKNKLPYRMGSATKDRKGAMDFSMVGPVINFADTSAGKRRFNSSQNASSDQSSTLSVSGT